MSETRTHIARARLPWRGAEGMTECGRDLADSDHIEWPDLPDFVKRHGQQRAAILMCMTCYRTPQLLNYSRFPLIHAIEREVQRVRGSWRTKDRSEERDRLERELRALATLVEAHPDEWRTLLVDLSNVESLESARTRRLTGGAA